MNRKTRQMSIVGVLCVAVLSASLAAAEKGWKPLFNGKDLANWQRVDEGYGGWTVDDESISLTERGGMLYTREEFDDFVLKAEYRLEEKVNSGIFLRTGDPKDPVQTGIEMQVLDDLGRPLDKHSHGSVYDCQEPKKLMTKPTGEWNCVTITCQGSRIHIVLNGAEIIDVDLDRWTERNKNPDGTPNKFSRAFKDMPRKGLLGLQDHGGRMWYRNLKVKRLG